ncbi:MAG: hypothetical protein CM1200mP30_23850 [Pseudomonadota bacterium]|nr:MAG: hypothetical protein CM1200mP30_23850 [Pseudomonadota bacterium]
MGYPGPIQINAQFSLLESGILDIVYTAETEKITISILHTIATLISQGKNDFKHELKINASTFLEVMRD